jgi:hypothetical protein
MKKRITKKTVLQLTTASVFIVYIAGMSLANVLAPKKTFSDNENRVLADFPSLSLDNVFGGTFDDQFETWFADHFINRDAWVETKAAVRKNSGSIENNTVYYGKDGRLIQQFSGYSQKIVDNNISYVNEFARENNLKANVMIIPGASYGEKEFLPFGSYNLDEKDMIEQIGKQFKNQNYIDITDSIASDSGLYFKTDHHWNEKGAAVGYKAICESVLNKEPETMTYEKVSDDFKGSTYSKSGAFWTEGESLYKMVPETPNPVKVTMEDGTVSDSMYFDQNLKKKDKYTYYLDGNHAYEDIQTSNKNGKTAVIVKDSYSHILIPYLAQEYSELKVVDLRYYRQPVSKLITDAKNTDFYCIYSLESFCSDTNLAALW